MGHIRNWFSSGGWVGCRSSLSLIAVIVLSACETPGPIGAEESSIVQRLESSGWPPITRELDVRPGLRTEEWSWRDGFLQLVQISVRHRYYSNDYADPEDFFDELDRWNLGERAHLDRRDIEIDSNSMGEFQFAVIDLRDEYCFFMLQGLHDTPTTGSGSIGSAETSSGYISFAECGSKRRLNYGQMQARGLEFARGLAKRR